MKVLIPFTCYPSKTHGTGAANKVFSNILSEIVKKKKIKFILLPINLTKKKIKMSVSEISFKNFLSKQNNVTFLNEIKMIYKDKKRNFFLRIFFPKLVDFFPVYGLKKKSQEITSQINPDYILVIWDEKMTDLFNFNNFKLYAYYGDPQIKNLRMILSLARRSLIKKLKDFYVLFKLEKQHINEFKKNLVMSNNSKADSNYYFKKGVNSEYLQNNWKPKFSYKKIRDALLNKNQKKIKIIANVGLLSGTANTIGLNYLANFVLPKMQSLSSSQEFEINVFGSGTIKKEIADKLLNYGVKIKGFVKNLDSEMLNSDIFLCCNNFGKYNVGHTRFLHAWSMGMCVITSKNISLVMPEFLSQKNCLLAENNDHLMELISKASENKKLRERIGLNGYKTLVNKFSPKLVAKKILDKLY